MGPGAVLVGYRYSTPPGPPVLPPPRVHPSLPCTASAVPGAALEQENSAVGLKSVRQLSLSVHISDIEPFTEVYNLVEIGRINNHNDIPGNK